MLLPLEWLKQYVPKLPSTEQLADTLMLHGMDVEEIISGHTYDKVVVGQIVGIKPHPNADKLRLADIIIVSDGQPMEIVCGAPNIEVGQKVPVALLGAKLPNGLTIEPRAIRGVTSNGMLCAKDELGLDTDHSGIIVLDKALKIGTPFAQAIGADEEVINLAVPANRADLMAMRGLAWEIGVMLSQAAKLPKVNVIENSTPANTSVTLNIADPKLCSLLTARVIKGAKLNPTPGWMVNRLRMAGMRSVNIIADITNYVMLDYGQPLHAYDASKVHGQSLIARVARPDEHLITLDRKMRQLTNDMLVIADADRVIGLAGVMGGKDTEVTNATTDIVLEAAIFNPVSIRKTSRQLGLISEASKRFEKGLWPSLPEKASAAAAALIVELCGGTVEQGSVRTGIAKTTPRTITMDPAYISERLGMKVPVTKSKTTLTKLGFAVEGTVKKWNVSVPEWRLDVSLPEDIVDEVGRMMGYEKLPKQLPKDESVVKELPPVIRFKEEVKNILVDMGFTEVISHAFYGEDSAKIILGKHFEVSNPLDATQEKLRRKLGPQILDILDRQADAGHDAMIFEIGNVFNPELQGSVERQQSWELALGITHKGEEKIKKTINTLQNRLSTTVQPKTHSRLEPVRGRTIELREFDLKELMDGSKKEFGPWDPDKNVVRNIQYREQSKYPAITRDISFWWPNDKQTLFTAIADLQAHNSLLWETLTKDEFFKNGKTSYLISFVYRSPDRTLTKVEVDKLEQKIKDALIQAGATIR